jgi:ABC-2 type transport system permease protein
MADALITTLDRDQPRGSGFDVPLGSQRQGPLRRYATLVHTLAVTDFKQRYAGSALGYFWTVSKPLMLFGILYTVFSHVLRVGADIPHYPSLLLVGIVLWGYFSEATSIAVIVLVQRADMLRKASFPRSALPVAVNVTALMVMSFNFLAVIVLVLWNGLHPNVGWIALPFLVMELTVLALGTSLVLSAAYVRMRDIGQIWQVVLQMIFYLTPIIYPIELVPVDWRVWFMFNPIAQIIQDTRASLLGDLTTASTSILGPKLLVVPFLVVLLVFVGGIAFYRQGAEHMAEHV